MSLSSNHGGEPARTRSRWTAILALAALLLASFTAVSAVPAVAAAGDIGFQGPSFTGVSKPPTSDKPQSKLWFNDGLWWATMFDSTSKTWHIFRLERSTETWVDTGTPVDNRVQTLSDALWDGQKLYVASQWATTSTNAAPALSVAGRPARLYRYSYSSATQKYTLDTGFPTNINNVSSESLSIDQDTTGKLWATWTQVSGSSAAGYTAQVYVNSTQGNDATWGTPMVLPAAGSSVSPDDISAVVAFAHGKIGVLWSNELDGSMYWGVHTDGDPDGTWRGSVAVRGSKQSDDHINLKTLQSDQAGRVYASVKTSLDELSGSSSTSPLINLLVFKPGTGAWSSSLVGTLSDCHTRPIVMLDEENSQVHVLATGPSSTGCPSSGTPGTIYDKVAPMDNPVFPSGRGTPVIRDAASAEMNNVTSTKQGVNSRTGLVALASNTVTSRYWHADLALAAKPVAKAPTASFTTSTTSGTAPLEVQFTDTSTGNPTSWSWNLGNGTTSTAQNPTTTYRAAGTYTVTMTATNAVGTSTPVTTTITVGPRPASAPVIVRASSSTAVATQSTAGLTIPRPSGTASGDLLVSCLALTSGRVAGTGVPEGWAPIAAVTEGGKPNVFGYYKVAGPSEPASYQWKFSTSVTSGGGIARYTGAAGLDVPASEANGTGATGTVPGVRTESDATMVVGCMGVASGSSSLSIAAPTGMSQVWATGGSNHEFVDAPQAVAGPTGDKTWRFANKVKWAGWLAVLRPS